MESPNQPGKVRSTCLVIVGIGLLICGLLLNQWSIGWLVSPSGIIHSFIAKVLIWTVQATLLLFAVLILIYRNNVRTRKVLGNILLVFGVLWLIFELTCGGWFRGETVADRGVLNSVEWTIDVSNLYDSQSSITYSRDHCGLRGSYPNPSVIDILTIGSSTTDNRMIDDSATWQAVLQREFMSKGDTVYIANAGVAGQPAYGNINSFERWFPLIPALKPPYVLFFLGYWEFARPPERNESFKQIELPLVKRIINKSGFWLLRRKLSFWLDPDFSYRVASLGGTHPAQLDWTKQPLLDSIAYDTIMASSLQSFERAILRLIALSRELGAEPIFVTQPTPLWKIENGVISGVAHPTDSTKGWTKLYSGLRINGVDAYHIMRRQDQLIKKLAVEQNALFIDVVPDSVWAPSDWFDEIHWSPQGCKKFGKLLYRELRPILDPNKATSNTP